MITAAFMWSVWSISEPGRAPGLRGRDALLVLALAGVLLMPALHLVTEFLGFDLDPDDHLDTFWSDRRTAAVTRLAVRATASAAVTGAAVLGCGRPWTGLRVVVAAVAIGVAIVFAAVEVPAAVAELARIDSESRLHPFGYP